MLTDLIKKHQRLAAHVARLEKEIEEERTAALAALPAEFGYPDVDSFVRALRAAAKPRRTVALRKRAPSPVSGRVASATHTPPAPPPAAQDSRPQKPLPTGTSLDDPANFGLLPDASVLEQGTLTPAAYQSRLSEALSFTQKVLHTSRVPASVWREWRQFEHLAIETLRTSKS